MLISWVARGTGLAAGVGMPGLLPWQPLAWGTSLMTDWKCKSDWDRLTGRDVCLACFLHIKQHFEDRLCMCGCTRAEVFETVKTMRQLSSFSCRSFCQLMTSYILDMHSWGTHTQIHLNTVKYWCFAVFDWLLNFLSLFSISFAQVHQALMFLTCSQTHKRAKAYEYWLGYAQTWCFNVLINSLCDVQYQDFFRLFDHFQVKSEIYIKTLWPKVY